MKKVCEYDTKISTKYENIIIWNINRKEALNIFDKLINDLIKKENKKIKFGEFTKEDKYGKIKLWGIGHWDIGNERAEKYLNNFNKIIRENMRKLIKSLGYKSKAVSKIK